MLRNEASQYVGSNLDSSFRKAPLRTTNYTFQNFSNILLDGCVYIHPKTAMDNMQCDFDGDLLAFSSSKDFPHLAAEVKERNLPENRYPDIIKRDKVAYKGSFEEIAISAMENKIGIIANEIQKNMALQCEICAMPQAEKFNYLQKVSAHFSFLVKRYEQGKLEIPEKILQQIYPIVSLRNNYQVEQKLQLVKKLFKNCVAELGNELQVAADGAKSALRPDDSIIQYCQAITGYKEVEWFWVDARWFLNIGTLVRLIQVAVNSSVHLPMLHSIHG
jgi:hypothetical protein